MDVLDTKIIEMTNKILVKRENALKCIHQCMEDPKYCADEHTKVVFDRYWGFLEDISIELMTFYEREYDIYIDENELDYKMNKHIEKNKSNTVELILTKIKKQNFKIENSVPILQFLRNVNAN